MLLSLKDNPPTETNKFDLWESLPFPRSSLLTEDFEWLLLEGKSCDGAWLKHAFFNLLFWVWCGGNFLPGERFELIDAFVQECETCKDEWQRSLVCNIDNATQRSKTHRYERDQKEKIEKEKSKQWLVQNIDKIKNGDTELLKHLSSKMINISDVWQLNLSVLEKEFGVTVRKAAEEGYSQAWQNASIQGVDYLSSSTSIPWIVIMLSHALENEWNARRVDWASATPEQVEAATVIAIKYRQSLPVWFEYLYLEKQSVIKDIFSRFLVFETTSDLEHPHLCWKFKYAKLLRQDFSQYAMDYLLSNQAPKNLVALDALLSVSIIKQNSQFTDYVMKNAQRDSYYAEFDPGKTSMMKMSFLIAWWYLDWRSAWLYLTNNVFVGPNKNNNVRIFVKRVDKICGKPGLMATGWPYDIDAAASISLVPFLYEAVLPEEDMEILRGLVSERKELEMLRDAIVNHISTTEPKRALNIFQEWVNNPLFRKHKEWFLSIIDNLERRLIDEQWQPVSADDAANVVLRSARIIRNSNDLFMLLTHILDVEMRKSLAEDTSLVPLLWEGTKKDGRIPRDEKPLQQVLANQLKHLLRWTQTIFAREPEVFDSKKPDFRVSATIPDFGDIHVAIEVKQAHADDVWSAPIEQLLEKYMKEITTNYGIYLVGWYGEKVKTHPETEESSNTFVQFQNALQSYVDGKLFKENRKIAVFVYDVCV